MDTPARLKPLVTQFDWACQRLASRMSGPATDSGDGVPVAAAPMTAERYLWEPVPGCWSVRRRADGPGPDATELLGAGEWGRDLAWPAPEPPPFTTISWRLDHLSDMLAMRADWTTGSHSMTNDDHVVSGTAAGAVAAFGEAAAAWRTTLLSVDDAALSTIGFSTYPNGSDSEDAFIDTVWWVNQEVLHHGAEIALLRDLYRAK